MPWIKRNLGFVLSAAVGLVLIFGALYFLYTNMEENSAINEDFKGAVDKLKELQGKLPTPSLENIQAAQDDQQRLRDFLADLKKIYVPINPPVEKFDERGFQAYLAKNILLLQAAAAGSGVVLPEQYSFSFSALYSAHNEKLNFSASSIEPWMLQLEEIRAICEVLYQAKINSLESVRRVPVSKDDLGGTDYIQTTAITNEFGIASPYEVRFRAFSSEIGAVLDGFLRSNHCILVKSISVFPSKPGAMGETVFASSIPVRAATPYSYRNPVAGPVTILAEKPLNVVLWVEALKLKVP